VTLTVGHECTAQAPLPHNVGPTIQAKYALGHIEESNLST